MPSPTAQAEPPEVLGRVARLLADAARAGEISSCFIAASVKRVGGTVRAVAWTPALEVITDRDPLTFESGEQIGAADAAIG